MLEQDTDTFLKLMKLQSLMESMRLIDLSHLIEESIPSWPTHPKFFSNRWEDYNPDLSRMNQWVIGEHTGTHMDAPLHYVQEGNSAHYGTDKIHLHHCMGRGVKISASALVTDNLLTLDSVLTWEKEHGAIMAGDIVLLHYGWHEKWKVGIEGVDFTVNWPGVDEMAARYLRDKKIKAIGTDALSIDVYGSEDFPSHYIFLNSEVLIIENLNNLSILPDFSYFMAFPLKVKGASGSPVRALAFI